MLQDCGVPDCPNQLHHLCQAETEAIYAEQLGETAMNKRCLPCLLKSCGVVSIPPRADTAQPRTSPRRNASQPASTPPAPSRLGREATTTPTRSSPRLAAQQRAQQAGSPTAGIPPWPPRRNSTPTRRNASQPSTPAGASNDSNHEAPAVTTSPGELRASPRLQEYAQKLQSMNKGSTVSSMSRVSAGPTSAGQARANEAVADYETDGAAQTETGTATASTVMTDDELEEDELLPKRKRGGQPGQRARVSRLGLSNQQKVKIITHYTSLPETERPTYNQLAEWAHEKLNLKARPSKASIAKIMKEREKIMSKNHACCLPACLPACPPACICLF